MSIKTFCNVCKRETIHIPESSFSNHNLAAALEIVYACYECGGDSKRLFPQTQTSSTPYDYGRSGDNRLNQ